LEIAPKSIPTQIATLADSAPAVFARGFELAPWDGEVFGLGLNNEMFHRSVNNSSFPPQLQSWEPLGGIFNSPPTAFFLGPEGAQKWAIIGFRI